MVAEAPRGLRFGLFLGQANKPLAQVYDEFQMAEDLGFDHAWLVDHLVDTDGPPSNPMLEAWTLLAAIAARTSRIRLGILVTSNTFRHPAIPDTATDGVQTELAERIRYVDDACRAIGRDPAEIRRSTWTKAESALQDEGACIDFVTRHQALGFTDFSTTMASPTQLPLLRRMAEEIIPNMRGGSNADG